MKGVFALRKGKLGIVLNFYPIVAFVLAILGQPLLCGLILGFVLLVEKDEWTTRQCMQALFLTLVSSVLSYVFGILAYIPIIGWLIDILIGILSLVILIFAIISLTKVVKGQEADMPVMSKWAYKAYGYMPQPPAPVMPQQPMYPQQPMQPMDQQPMAAPPAMEQQPAPVAPPVAPHDPNVPPQQPPVV